MKFIIGKKIEMSQLFDEAGTVVPVTLVSAGPCAVLQKKTRGKDGYEAIQLGFEKVEKKRRIKKTMFGKEYRYLREVRNPNDGIQKNVGDAVTVGEFKVGDRLTVSGISKGKGFQGGVKRHGFSGRNRTHGAKHEARTVGSIGRRFPQHTTKGWRMPGRMGAERVTVKNLVVAAVDEKNNLIAIKGAIPGHRGTVLEIRAT